MAPGVELAAAYVSIVPSAKGIAQQLQRELGDPAEKAAKDAGRSIEEGIGGGASRGAAAAKVAISAIGSAAIISGLNRAKDAASGLQQAAGGTAAVFGEASAAVDEFAANAAESVGLSERAARELTSQLGASLKGYGFAVDEAARKSIELTEVGADLAATFGGTTADAVGALSSALRGEFDPLERYGIALRQSAIDAEAVELGLVGAGEEVSSLARAQAALTLITEQSADAQGQFLRESDSAAGQAQISGAKMEDAAANLGESLLPIYAKISETIGTVAEVFAALPGPVQTGILALAGVVAIAGPLTNAISLYRTFATTATTSLATAGAAQAAYTTQAVNSAAAVSTLYASQAAAPGLLSRLGPAFGAAGVAAAGAAVSIGIWNRAMDQAQERAEEFGGNIRESAFDDETFADFSANIDVINRSIADFQETIDNSSSPIDADYRRELQAGIEELENLRATQETLTPVIESLAGQTGDADSATRLILANIETVTTALDDGYTPAQAAAAAVVADRQNAEAAATATTEAFGEEAETAAQRTDRLNDSLEDGIRNLRDFFGIQSSTSEASIAFRDSLQEIADLGTRVAEGVLTGQERIDEFATSIIGGRDNILDFAEALIRTGTPIEDVITQVQGLTDELFDQADQAGLTSSEVAFLRAEYGLLPDQIRTTIETNLEEVTEEILLVNSALGAALDRLAKGGDFTIGGVTRRAEGGPMEAGKSYLFEGHPEILTMGPGMASGQVTPLADIFAAAPSSGGLVQNFFGPTDAVEVGRQARKVQLVWS